MKNAIQSYGKLFLQYKDSVKPEYYFKFAHSLLGVAEYEKADKIMAEYLKYNVNTPKFIANLKKGIDFQFTGLT